MKDNYKGMTPNTRQRRPGAPKPSIAKSQKPIMASKKTMRKPQAR